MTSITSILSTPSLPTRDIMVVAADCILAIGDMVSALREAHHTNDETFNLLATLQTRFIGMTGADGSTSYVPDTADDDNVVPYTPDASNVVIVAGPAPDVVACNDITTARERIVNHVRSQLRVSKKAALSFIGRTDGKDILDTLVNEGALSFVKHGRTKGYAIAPVTLDAPPVALPSVPTSVQGDDAIPEGFGDTPAGFGSDNTPTPVQAAPPASNELDTLRARAKSLGIKGAHLFKDADKLAQRIKDAEGTQPIANPPAPAPVAYAPVSPDVSQEMGKQTVPYLPHVSTADLLAELSRRIGTAIPAQNKGRATGAIKELSRVFGLS